MVDHWKAFITELQDEILPLYTHHEAIFDFVGMHGRMHICRAVLFSEWMARRYLDWGETVDLCAVRFAAAFHDSGREANGFDLWEEESAENCRKYLEKRSTSRNGACALQVKPGEAGGYILKTGDWGLNQRIAQDADVLEIMRPCCGVGGLPAFRRSKLLFLRDDDPYCSRAEAKEDLRETLVQEAWRWIQATEAIKPGLFKVENYMERLLEFLGEKKNSFPLLAQLL